MTKTPRRILLIRTSALGDVVMALPVVRTLRSIYPEARIDWAVEETSASILEDNPDLSRALILRTKRWRQRKSLSALQEMAETIRQLRSAEYDLTLDLQGLIKSGFIARITGARLRIGYHRSRCREPFSARFNNLHVQTRADTHIVDQQLELLRPLGIIEPDRRFQILLRREDERHAEEFISRLNRRESGPIVINPGASWPTKRWPQDRYVALAQRIVDVLGFPVVVTWGGEAEGRQAHELVRRAGRGVFLAPPTDIRQLAALLSKCRLFIGSDTGPLHIAAALGVPTVALFGPSDPHRNGPYGNTSRILHSPLPCSGCYRRQCPDPVCIRSIRIDEVFAAVREVV
ncbi:MAG: lipopolysaccharide heptosyltransferase I [Deltaproteobacteria bacterium]|nr:lipopolysaccharide heptosyltransferase I [Deltaproteobacteria bacterium]